MKYLTIAIGALGLTSLAGASAISAQDIEPLPEPVPSETPVPDLEPAEPATDDAGIPVQEPVPADPAPPVPVEEEDMPPPPAETDSAEDDDTAVDPLDPAGMDEEPETEEPL